MDINTKYNIGDLVEYIDYEDLYNHYIGYIDSIDIFINDKNKIDIIYGFDGNSANENDIYKIENINERISYLSKLINIINDDDLIILKDRYESRCLIF